MFFVASTFRIAEEEAAEVMLPFVHRRLSLSTTASAAGSSP
jgi:hypothetical protein